MENNEQPSEQKPEKKHCPMCNEKTNSMVFVDDDEMLGVFCVRCVVNLLGAAVPDRRRFEPPPDVKNDNA